MSENSGKPQERDGIDGHLEHMIELALQGLDSKTQFCKISSILKKVLEPVMISTEHP
jgi:hypothetical protein